MRTVKILIFIFGIGLTNYIGGIPNDARNLFITHTIFFAPYLVDFYPLTKIRSNIKWIIYLLWGVGILTFAANILGVGAVITIEDSRVIFNQNYYSPFHLNMSISLYLKLIGYVYAAVFMGGICFKYITDFDKRMVAKRSKKKEERKKVTREELVKNVSA